LRAINVSALLCNPAAYVMRRPENLETLMALFFAEQGLQIERFPRSMMVIRSDSDSSNWSVGDDMDGVHMQHGVLIKYPTELVLAKQTTQQVAYCFDLNICGSIA
jgi:hypothetical protein